MNDWILEILEDLKEHSDARGSDELSKKIAIAKTCYRKERAAFKRKSNMNHKAEVQ